MRALVAILALAAVGLPVAAWRLASARAAEAADQAERAARPPRVPIVAVGSRIAWNVPYVDGAGTDQMLDVYAPDPAVAERNAPVVVYVHRGEWAKGDKSEVSYKPKLFNEAGIVFVSVNYRLSGTATHPAQVEDVAAALRWVKDHIAEHGGAPGRIVLMGHSAGCHIVSLTGLDPRPLAKFGLTPGDLAGVVCWSGGAYDLPAKVAEAGMYKEYIERNFSTDTDAQAEASPIRHVSEADPSVRFLFVSGENGRASSKALSERMATEIRAAGGRAESLVLAGKTHFTVDYECGLPEDPTDSGAMLIDFVEEATELRID